MLSRQPPVIGGPAHWIVDLGCQNQMIARNEFQKGARDHFFVDTQRIPVGHIIEGDPGLDRTHQKRARLGLIQDPGFPGAGPEAHGAKTVFADCQAGAV